jgi:hypothetical protein
VDKGNRNEVSLTRKRYVAMIVENIAMVLNHITQPSIDEESHGLGGPYPIQPIIQGLNHRKV